VSTPYGQEIETVEKTVSRPFPRSLAGWRWLQFFGAIDRETAGVEHPLVLPARSPNLNAYAERWVRSVKEECLSKVILFGERSQP